MKWKREQKGKKRASKKRRGQVKEKTTKRKWVLK